MSHPFPRKVRKYLSKSKMGTFNNCPYSFKLSYIDKKEKEIPYYFTIGSNVHDYIEKYFNRVEATRTLKNEYQLDIPEDIANEAKYKRSNYYKNFIIFEAKRWCKCVKAKPKNPLKYYLPVLNEEKLISYKKQLIGIVDRVHLGFDDSYIVVENKTGKPTSKKVENYTKDLLWYKLLLKDSHNFDIQKGSIYFPYNNVTVDVELTDKDSEELYEKINNTKRAIKKSLDIGFKPTPNKSKCNYCLVKKHCKYRRDK